MPLELHIPACVSTPACPLHPPPPDRSLRIQIEGPLVSIQKLLPNRTSSSDEEKGPMWPIDVRNLGFPQPGGKLLAELAFKHIYGREARPEILGDFVLRDEYLGWVQEVPLREMDYYGVTFDHLVTTGDADPEVLQINIIEMDDDKGKYAYDNLRFAVDTSEYTGKKVLAVPRCCQIRKGTQDRGRVNSMVIQREATAVQSKSVGETSSDDAHH